MKRRVFQIAAAIVVVAVLGSAGVFYYIDQLARWAVERGATYALGVPTSLGSMDIGIMTGRVELARLEVANPEGFTAPRFVGLGEGRVAVTLGTLMQDTVELPELTLKDIDMVLERRGGSANYQPILDNLARLGSKETPAAESPDSKKFVIRKLTIQDITVDAQLTQVGGELTRVPVTIERIELTDIGSQSDRGVLMSELTGIVTKAILTAVVRKAGHLLPEVIAGELGAGLERLGKVGHATVHVVGEVTALVGGKVQKIGERGRDLIEGIGETGVDVLRDPRQAGTDIKDAAGAMKDEAKEAGKEVKEGLGRLLGKKKKDDGGD